MKQHRPEQHCLPLILRCNTGHDIHIHNRMKVGTPNNLLRKRANSKWGTIRTTALVLCHSVAKYVATVWLGSKLTHLLNLELNQACRAIAGCMKPTNLEDMYLLTGIAPPDIRRSMCTNRDSQTGGQ